MLLAVDVGNTNITFGIYEGERLVGTFRMTTKQPRTSDEYGVTIRCLLESRGIQPEQIDAVIERMDAALADTKKEFNL